MNAVKLERVFAKPFLGSLDGHRDGVNCLVKHPKSLSLMLSGACDGEVCKQINIVVKGWQINCGAFLGSHVELDKTRVCENVDGT